MPYLQLLAGALGEMLPGVRLHLLRAPRAHDHRDGFPVPAAVLLESTEEALVLGVRPPPRVELATASPPASFRCRGKKSGEGDTLIR